MDLADRRARRHRPRRPPSGILLSATRRHVHRRAEPVHRPLGTRGRDRRQGGGIVARPATTSSRSPSTTASSRCVGSTTADLVDDQLEISVQASALGLTGVTGKRAGHADLPRARTTASRSSSRRATSSSRRSPSCAWRSCCRPAPSPTPSPSTSPSPTMSPSPSVSPSPSASASPTSDQQVIDGIAKLQVGIVTWATNNNNLYPPPRTSIEGGGVASTWTRGRPTRTPASR